MHAAPSVTYPVGRSAFAGLLSAATGAAGLVAILLWAWFSPGFGARQAAALAVLAASCAFGWQAWRRSPQGNLRWDGSAWQWEEGGEATPGQPELALDLQSRLLVRWRGDAGGTRWLWLERKSDVSDWDALRRAVYSRASPPERAAGKPPAAEQ